MFLTDSGDNTTGGSAGDSTTVLRRLLAHKVPDAVLAGIVDPEAVEACEQTGAGNEIRVTIDHPFRVLRVANYIKAVDRLVSIKAEQGLVANRR